MNWDSRFWNRFVGTLMSLLVRWIWHCMVKGRAQILIYIFFILDFKFRYCFLHRKADLHSKNHFLEIFICKEVRNISCNKLNFCSVKNQSKMFDRKVLLILLMQFVFSQLILWFIPFYPMSNVQWCIINYCEKITESRK